MCNKSTLDKILKEVSSAYKKVYGDKLVKVVLYGSYARGDYDEESDIDIVGIIKADRIETKKLEKRLWYLTNDIDLKYDAVTSAMAIPYKEFLKYQNSLPYYINIEKEGIDISA